MKRHSQHGMALVITLIMLSVITFMAVTFLALSRRERGAVGTSTDQTVAREASLAALERAKAELVARILAANNPYNFDLLVSTNYINPWGFTNGVADPRNVNYDSLAPPRTGPLAPAQRAQNIANLLYSPRPPVFVNVPGQAAQDFRYYLDLNRNGRFDPTGLLPVLNNAGQATTNFDNFGGDPQWIGQLQRADAPHGPDNRFADRYAFLVVPIGRALDLNYIHNYSKLLQPQMSAGKGDGFMRNEGVGTWDLNLAAFLTDLNPNVWPYPAGNAFGAPYAYSPNLALANTGAAFDDALSLLRYRYTGNYRNLGLSPSMGYLPFDGIDYNSDGTLFVNDWVLPPEDNHTRMNIPFPGYGYAWAGNNNPNHYFTPQELFDPTKTSAQFVDRLQKAGAQLDSFDKYTYYRLLAQLGTDSAPEAPGKVNLNYDNLVQRNPSGVASSTNFYEWTPVAFFTNAADQMLRAYSSTWLAANPTVYKATYGTDAPFGVGNIPVLVNGQFVYTPAVQRVLQLAANLYDATTNRFNPRASGYPYLPSVFRPYFVKLPAGTNVYIAGFYEVGVIAADPLEPLSPPFDLQNPVDFAKLQVGITNYVNVFGVPLVIGAKKGLPNFNECSMNSVFELTRKAQVTRPSATALPNETNVLYVLSITNFVGVELWNSYRTAYPRPVGIYLTNYLNMALTNDAGLSLPFASIQSSALTANGWPGYGFGSSPNANSFVIPLSNSIVMLPDAIYRYGPTAHFELVGTNTSPAFEVRGNVFTVPKWGLLITNRLQVVMVDRLSGRLIDYVQLNGMNSYRDLSEEVRTPNNAYGLNGLWSTNKVGGVPVGMINQAEISLGHIVTSPADWNNATLGNYNSSSVSNEIWQFKTFLTTNNSSVLAMQVPFSPTRRMSQYFSWQANDPLVHYTASDLADLENGNGAAQPMGLKAPIEPLQNLRRLNLRYRPWGGNPEQSSDRNAFNLALKDPMVTRSDDWNFPTNKFPNVGWIGRVHRGTPWQTVYMKATEVLLTTNGAVAWRNWTGNPNQVDNARYSPTTDRLLFDVFTTGVSDNATRGQLPINQSGLAAWSAVLSGVMALSNNASDTDLQTFNLLRLRTPPGPPLPALPGPIQPAGSLGNASPLGYLVNGPFGINNTRASHINPDGQKGVFEHIGDILGVPALTELSPILNLKSQVQREQGIDDAMYERLPQQIMSLLRMGGPRFVIYSYGQALHPAPNSTVMAGGPFFGMCTNYQVTAEVATRAVVRVDGAPQNPRVVVEQFNLLPPD